MSRQTLKKKRKRCREITGPLLMQLKRHFEDRSLAAVQTYHNKHYLQTLDTCLKR